MEQNEQLIAELLLSIADDRYCNRYYVSDAIVNINSETK